MRRTAESYTAPLFAAPDMEVRIFTSAKDLIEKKTNVLQRIDEKVVVSIEDLGEWQFKVPSASDILDAQTYERTHGKTGEVDADVYLVYNQCEQPNLHDEALQKAYDVHGPVVLRKLLRAGEVDELAKMLMQKAGYYGGTIEIIAKGAEEVKNS